MKCVQAEARSSSCVSSPGRAEARTPGSRNPCSSQPLLSTNRSFLCSSFCHTHTAQAWVGREAGGRACQESVVVCGERSFSPQKLLLPTCLIISADTKCVKCGPGYATPLEAMKGNCYTAGSPHYIGQPVVRDPSPGLRLPPSTLGLWAQSVLLPFSPPPPPHLTIPHCSLLPSRTTGGDCLPALHLPEHRH